LLCRREAEATNSYHRHPQSKKTHNSDTPASMNNLTKVLSRQGNCGEAEEMQQQILGLKEIALGKEHPSILTSMNNLVEVLRLQGKHEQAEETHR
jgi:hypothetical protein